MKKLAVLTLLAAALVLATPRNAQANDYQRGNSDHPFRVLVYPFHAFGTMLEWAIIRPVHWLVSKPKARQIFGHTVNENDEYWRWDEYR